jgi:hypothetical protein
MPMYRVERTQTIVNVFVVEAKNRDEAETARPECMAETPQVRLIDLLDGDSEVFANAALVYRSKRGEWLTK